MTNDEFIRRVIGRPWANRACSFSQMDCWGLVVLYYRHVLNKELHHIPGYESESDFVTCYMQERAHWQKVIYLVKGCLAVFYRGEYPSHVGVMISPGKCLHSRGEQGFVRIDSPLTLTKVYQRVEYLKYGEI
ncbi:NlpC/P60 family protein [Tatumella citrea]|uniref:NlpC/P60 domain-containing protein n=1 Tax=Tatumella citrea TaxID=53336 RepID=A0A1Y0LA68_TATCI|nr:NlpC/P60 family protein [Tatumella citrea]ARU94549.1 hypothetical protein A7K98_12720 [Tatumella citrea]ARU98587.1 hypothetical protein A7K99_12710 [Tatumella citrea]